MLCYVAALASGNSLPRRISPCCAIFSPYWGTSNFHFFLTHPVFGSNWWRGGEDVYLHLFLSSFTDSAYHPAGQLLCHLPPAQLSRSSTPPPPLSGSRGGRPVSAGTIGKQRPKMYFPVSFPSPTSKHSNRSRKSVVGPQFLFTMNYRRLAATSSATKI